jgi:ceramide glucosyltransferase
MAGPVLTLLTLIGWLLVGIMIASQRRLLAAPHRAPVSNRPAVSILKPLKGSDPDLERNLESFFQLDYPSYEVLFGAEDPSDPCLVVARRVASRYPGVRTAFVAGGRQVGLNPKVNNLANIAAEARHEILLISDSNVAMAPDRLAVLVDELERPGVGLVTAPIRALGGEGLGGLLERTQLNTFVIGGVAAVSQLLGGVCAVGKTMMLRRRELARIGGWAELGRYLAEDQVSAEAVRALGLRVMVAPRPVDTPLGRLTVRQFASRHLRWARLRRRLAPAGYLGELLTNPLPFALLHLVVAPGAVSLLLAIGTLGIATAWIVASERRLGLQSALAPAVAAAAVRGMLIGLLWPVPYVSSSVVWRGRRLAIDRRTLLVPEGDDWLAGEELAEEPAPSGA